MEYGFQFANLAPARVHDLARVAEGEGFDLIVFPDHVVLEGAEGVYDPHALGARCRSARYRCCNSDDQDSGGTPRVVQSVPASGDSGAEPRHTGSRQQRQSNCRNRRWLDRDRVPHDWDPVSAGHRAPRDAR